MMQYDKARLFIDGVEVPDANVTLEPVRHPHAVMPPGYVEIHFVVSKSWRKKTRVQHKRWLGRHTRWIEMGKELAWIEAFERMNGWRA